MPESPIQMSHTSKSGWTEVDRGGRAEGTVEAVCTIPDSWLQMSGPIAPEKPGGAGEGATGLWPPYSGSAHSHRELGSSSSGASNPVPPAMEVPASSDPCPQLCHS